MKLLSQRWDGLRMQGSHEQVVLSLVMADRGRDRSAFLFVRPAGRTHLGVEVP